MAGIFCVQREHGKNSDAKSLPELDHKIFHREKQSFAIFSRVRGIFACNIAENCGRQNSQCCQWKSSERHKNKKLRKRMNRKFSQAIYASANNCKNSECKQH